MDIRSYCQSYYIYYWFIMFTSSGNGKPVSYIEVGKNLKIYFSARGTTPLTHNGHHHAKYYWENEHSPQIKTSIYNQVPQTHTVFFNFILSCVKLHFKNLTLF